MTGQFVGDHIELAHSIGVGLAVAVPDGLVAPVIKEVDKKDIRLLAAESKAIAERARAGKLAPTILRAAASRSVTSACLVSNHLFRS